MKISKKAEYGLRAVVILAGGPSGSSVQIQELAEKGDIPVKFLEQILLSLKKGGLLKSKRGVGGGYQLNREPRNISVGDIIQTIDGSLSSLGEETPPKQFPGSHGLQTALKSGDELINEHLRQQTIESILNYESGDSMVGFGI